MGESSIFRAAIIAAFGMFLGSSATAQQSDLMIVMDGSGSMWGQIEGRTKIEIARDTLTQVLEEITSDMNIGMIAYGHRTRGDCSDIEMLVPVSPAAQAVPQMISAAAGLRPNGKTPLTDAVRLAAQTMRHTENAATVVLVTDGIETCDADPCALAAELERTGIDFAAHVVGFGLSADEGRQVQCLADQTGGLYLSADDAGALQDALQQTLALPVIPVDDSDFTPVGPTPRNVDFIIRDTADSDMLGIRQLTMALTDAAGMPVTSDDYKLNYPEVAGKSGSATLLPGMYTAVIGREGIYDATVTFDVPEGDGVHVVPLNLAARLAMTPMLNPVAGAFDPANPPASNVKNVAWTYYHIFPIQDGVPADTPIVEAYQDLDFALPAGDYLIRANIDRTTSVEKEVTVAAGGTTQVDFSFDVTRVFVEAVEDDGMFVARQSTYFYDQLPSGRNYFGAASGIAGDDNDPFYLPTGTFIVDAGGEGYGERRSQFVLTVPGDYRDIRIQIAPGQRIDADEAGFFSSPAHQPCAMILSVKYSGCLMRAAAPEQAATTPTITLQTAGTAFGTITAATLTLQPEWCGQAGCDAVTLPVPADIVTTFETGEFAMIDLGESGYLLNLNAGGEPGNIGVISQNDGLFASFAAIVAP